MNSRFLSDRSHRFHYETVETASEMVEMVTPEWCMTKILILVDGWCIEASSAGWTGAGDHGITVFYSALVPVSAVSTGLRERPVGESWMTDQIIFKTCHRFFTLRTAQSLAISIPTSTVAPKSIICGATTQTISTPLHCSPA